MAKPVYLQLPVTATVGSLVDPEIDITSLKTRLGGQADAPITLIDAADLRLLAAGVVLAHRVLAGRGEWVLATTGWEPYLPGELVEPFGHGDLPEEFSSLTRPFRRTAPLGVQGVLTVERQVYEVMSAAGEPVATLVDERSEVQRAAETQLETRLVKLTPRQASTSQLAWLVSRLKDAGGVVVPRPATGLVEVLRPLAKSADYAAGDRIGPDIAMREFTQVAVRRRLRRIITADLAFRTGGEVSPDELYYQLDRMRQTIAGIAWASEADTSDLVADLDYVLARPGSAPFGERYLAALDRLVAFARTPRLGEWSDRQASAVLAQEIDRSLVTVVDRARRLDRHSPTTRWEKTRVSAEHCLHLTRLARRFFGARARGLRRRLEEIVVSLDECVPPVVPDPDLAGMSVAEAYAAGREHERLIQAGEAARVDFIVNWPEHHRYFKRLGIKP